jgi:hypothetical protein
MEWYAQTETDTASPNYGQPRVKSWATG